LEEIIWELRLFFSVGISESLHSEREIMIHRKMESPESCCAGVLRSGAHSTCAVTLAPVPNLPIVARAMLRPTFLVISIIVASFATALAAPAIEGNVIGADGRPLKGAEVRIERKDKASPAITAATDARGHYLASGLSIGLYRISVIEGGAVKSSLDVKTSDRNAPVDFNLKPVAGKGKKVKKMVWVPSGTATHIGGRWVEEGSAPDAGGANVEKKKAEAAQEWLRHQTNPKGP
jgi:hypothetical protein